MNLDAIKQGGYEENHGHMYQNTVSYKPGGVTIQLHSTGCYKERNSSLYVRIIHLSLDFLQTLILHLSQETFKKTIHYTKEESKNGVG